MTRFVRLAAWGIVVGVGCDTPDLAKATRPSRVIVPGEGGDDGSGLDYIPLSARKPCVPGGYACGEVRPTIGSPVLSPYLTMSQFDIGVVARTWSPGGYTGEMQLTGNGTVTRGSGLNVRTESFSLACTQIGSECGDGWRSPSGHTCDVQANKIEASTRHSATFAGSVWYGTFSDSRQCPGPGKLASSVIVEGGDQVAVGGAMTLAATATAADGELVACGTWDWRTSNGDVASVNGEGYVTGLQIGAVEITAACGDVSDSHTVQVVERSDCDDPLTDEVETVCPVEPSRYSEGGSDWNPYGVRICNWRKVWVSYDRGRSWTLESFEWLGCYDLYDQ